MKIKVWKALMRSVDTFFVTLNMENTLILIEHHKFLHDCQDKEVKQYTIFSVQSETIKTQPMNQDQPPVLRQ